MPIDTTTRSHTVAIPLGAVHPEPPELHLPMGAARVALGFPSPAEDFLDEGVDLNQVLIRNPTASYLYRASGWSMILAGICDGDILVVDRSIEPVDGHIVIATWEGNQPTCKVLRLMPAHIELHCRNPRHPPIVLPSETEVEIYVVASVARQMHRGHGQYNGSRKFSA